MATTWRCLLAFVVTVLLAVLSGCASPVTPPTPLSYRQRMIEIEGLFDQNWAIVSRLHPDAVRPMVNIVHIASGDTWVRLMTDCLHDRGVRNVAVLPSGTIAVEAEVQDRAAIDVAEYACDVEYPRKAVFNSHLSASQLGALYDYYVGFLQPCLMGFGLAVPQTPARDAFISGYYRGNHWSPYNGATYRVGRSGTSPVVERCPALPAWIEE
ncbi:hypothetical protein [Lacisediminihabitans sp.]|uniref:hypothetical protein n=1 Tax=Lacisediminihabitans sp. TaxID=2787631 RepID=UPI00374C9234